MTIPNVNITVLDGALGIIQPSTANVQAKLGTCHTGAVGTLYSFTSPTQALATLGYGPLTEAVCHALAVAGGNVLAMPVNPSVAGAPGSVTHTGSGAGTVVTTGTVPFDSYNVLMTIILGGLKGTMTFTYSLDGGKSTSPVITSPSGGTYAIPNSGVDLVLDTGAYVAGDTYTFQCTAPGYASGDVTTAMTALLAQPNTWGWVHLVGQLSTASSAATLAGTLETTMESAASTNFRYAFAVLEAPDDTDSNLESAFASVNTPRVMVAAGFEDLASSLTGLTLKRSAGFPVTARMGLVPVSQDLGQVSTGSLPGVTKLYRDENATPGLDAAGFTTLRTLVGQPGFYVTTGRLFVPLTSDYTLVQNRRVMDLACTVSRAALLYFLNSSVRVKKSNGTIQDADAARIEAFVGGQISAAIVAPGFASAASLVVDRTNNVLSTQTINVSTRIVPLGYAKTINENIGFLNPALQIQAAA